MPTNIRTVTFTSPADQAAAAIEEARLSRNQALADAMRRQSMEPIDAGAGRASWTQGLAKMAQALAARSLTRENEKAQYGLAARQQNAAAAMHDPSGRAIPQIDLTTGPYGKSEPNGTVPGARASQVPPTSPATDDAGSGLWTPAERQAAIAKLEGQEPEVNSSAPVTSASPTIDAGPTAPAVPAGAPSAPTADTTRLVAALRGTTNPPQVSPVSPELRLADALGRARNPGQSGVPTPIDPTAAPGAPGTSSTAAAVASAQTQAANGPSTAQIAGVPDANGAGNAGTPGPVMDEMLPNMTARQGYMLQMNSPEEFWKAMAANNAPTEAQRALHAAGIDPNSPQGQHMLNEAAKKATLTPLTTDRRGYVNDPYTGAMLGYHPALETGQQPVADAEGRVTGAATLPGFAQSSEDIAAAKARGQAAGDVVTGYDPVTRQPILRPKTDVLNGRGGPIYAGPPTGAAAGADQAFRDSQKGFTDDAAAGAGAPQRKFLLGQIRQLAQTTVTGQGAPGIAAMKSRLNTALMQAGQQPWFDNQGIANVQEIQKNVANLAQQQAAAYGGRNGSTDAKLQAAFEALPDANKAPQAIQTIVSILSAGEDALAAKQQAAAAYNRANPNDPNGHANFLADWSRNADPDLFQRIAVARSNPHALTAGLTKPQAADLLRRYMALRGMGAF